MTDGIALVAVFHQLRLRGCAGGEVEQHRIIGGRRAVRREVCACRVGVIQGGPAGRGAADNDAGVFTLDIGELGRICGADDDVADAAAIEPIEQVVAGEQRRRRDDDRAQLDGGQHHLP